MLSYRLVVRVLAAHLFVCAKLSEEVRLTLLLIGTWTQTNALVYSTRPLRVGTYAKFLHAASSRGCLAAKRIRFCVYVVAGSRAWTREDATSWKGLLVDWSATFRQTCRLIVVGIGCNVPKSVVGSQ